MRALRRLPACLRKIAIVRAHQRGFDSEIIGHIGEKQRRIDNLNIEPKVIQVSQSSLDVREPLAADAERL